MERISNYIYGWLEQNSKDKSTVRYKKIYTYGIELIISSLIGVLIVGAESVFLNMFAEGMIFYVSFVCLRIYTGGYHAKSYLRCNTLFAVAVFLCLYLQKSFGYWLDIRFSVLLGAFNLFFFYWMVPVVNLKKPLDIVRKQKCKYRSMLVQAILIVTQLFMYNSDYDPGKSIFCAMIITDILIIVEIMKNFIKHSAQSQRR